MSAGCATVIDFDAAKDGSIGILTGNSAKKTFRFDRVYTPSDNQGNDIFLCEYVSYVVSVFSYDTKKHSLCAYQLMYLQMLHQW